MIGRPRLKFNTPYRISAMCKYCTPEKASAKGHNVCHVVNCICPHHGVWTREVELKPEIRK
jgi:hypothetical protein